MMQEDHAIFLFFLLVLYSIHALMIKALMYHQGVLKECGWVGNYVDWFVWSS